MGPMSLWSNVRSLLITEHVAPECNSIWTMWVVCCLRWADSAFSCARDCPLLDGLGHSLIFFPRSDSFMQCVPLVHSGSTQFRMLYLLLVLECSVYIKNERAIMSFTLSDLDSNEDLFKGVISGLEDLDIPVYTTPFNPQHSQVPYSQTQFMQCWQLLVLRGAMRKCTWTSSPACGWLSSTPH